MVAVVGNGRSGIAAGRVVGAHIRSYRGITDLMLPFGPVTVLIGRNGAGKSSILEALGFRTAEEGALERRGDDPPVVSWFIARPRGMGAAEFLSPLLVEIPEADEPRRHAAHRVGKHVVLAVDPSGKVDFAADLFASILDHPERERAAISDRLLCDLELVATEWSARVAESISSSAVVEQPFVLLHVGAEHVSCAIPRAISMIAVPDDISPTLFGCITRLACVAYGQLAADQPGVAAALQALERGLLRPLHALGGLEPLIRLLEVRVNQLVPGFVVGGDKEHGGRISIDLFDGPDSSLGSVMSELLHAAAGDVDGATSALLLRCVAAMAAAGDSADMHLDCSLLADRSEHAEVFPFSRLGTGARRWICGAIDEAARDVIDAPVVDRIRLDEDSMIRFESSLAGQWAPGAFDVGLRLIDEPLENLEAGIHSDVLAWLRQQSTGAETLVLSSHHPSVLRVASVDADLEVIGIERVSGTVQARIFGPSLLKGLRNSFAELGFRREDLLFNARALLLVEGPDDVRVLEAVYGDRLYEMGVLVKALGGTGAPQIVAAFSHTGYELLELKTWAMFDSVYDDRLADDEHFPTSKRYAPSELRQAAATLGVETMRVIPFDPVDICLGLTSRAYRLAFPGGFKRNGKPIPSGQILMEMQQCATSAEAKKLLQNTLRADPKRGFSPAVMTPVITAIREKQLGVNAANKWLRSSLQRLEDEIIGT